MPPKNETKHRASTTRIEKEQGYAMRMERCIADSPFPNLDRLRNFSLYAPRQDLTNFLVRYEIFKRVLTVGFEKQSESNAQWALSPSLPFRAHFNSGPAACSPRSCASISIVPGAPRT